MLKKPSFHKLFFSTFLGLWWLVLRSKVTCDNVLTLAPAVASGTSLPWVLLIAQCLRSDDTLELITFTNMSTWWIGVWLPSDCPHSTFYTESLIVWEKPQTLNRFYRSWQTREKKTFMCPLYLFSHRPNKNAVIPRHWSWLPVRNSNKGGHCNKTQETGPDVIKPCGVCHCATLWVGWDGTAKPLLGAEVSHGRLCIWTISLYRGWVTYRKVDIYLRHWSFRVFS